MSIQPTIPFTWKSLLRIGAGSAAEFALLTLIADSPESVKVVTLVVAISALGALEFQEWLTKRHRYLFFGVIGIAGTVYLGFVGYAVFHTYEEANTKSEDALQAKQRDQHLHELYLQGSAIWTRQLTIKDQDDARANAVACDKWMNEAREWLRTKMGSPAEGRFLDDNGVGVFAYLERHQEYPGDCFRALPVARGNMRAIIESPAWGP